MSESLDSIRMDIDAVDSQLILLLARRLELVDKVGQIKRKEGLPVRDVSREQSLLEKMRDKATKNNLPVSLIESIMPSIFHESYKQEHQKGYKRLGPKKIVIIGVKGKMGQLFYEYFSLSGYEILGLDKDDDISDKAHYHDAGLVFLAVGLSSFESVLKSLPELPANCLLVDISSIKEQPMKLMSAHHAHDVIGLHPLFGPNIDCMAGHKIACCIGKNQGGDWLFQQFKLWGVDLVECEPREHDKVMFLVQAIRFYVFMMYGYILKNSNIDISIIKNLSPKPFEQIILLLQHFFSGNATVYQEIIKLNMDKVGKVVADSERYIKKNLYNKFDEVYITIGSFIKKNDLKENKK